MGYWQSNQGLLYPIIDGVYCLTRPCTQQNATAPYQPSPTPKLHVLSARSDTSHDNDTQQDRINKIISPYLQDSRSLPPYSYSSCSWLTSDSQERSQLLNALYNTPQKKALVPHVSQAHNKGAVTAQRRPCCQRGGSGRSHFTRCLVCSSSQLNNK